MGRWAQARKRGTDSVVVGGTCVTADAPILTSAPESPPNFSLFADFGNTDGTDTQWSLDHSGDGVSWTHQEDVTSTSGEIETVNRDYARYWRLSLDSDGSMWCPGLVVSNTVDLDA